MKNLLLVAFVLVSTFCQAQTSDEKIRTEIFQRAETFYANEQYSQAADLLDRLIVLKIPYDFKSIYLKIKALSNVYNTSEKYFSMMESSISTYATMSKNPENAQKEEELSGIVENFRNLKNAESIAYEKARNGSLKDKEDFLSKFPGSVHADEVRKSKEENTLKEKALKITQLENEIKALDKKRVKASRKMRWGFISTMTGIAPLVIGIGGLEDYEYNSKYNEGMIRTKQSAMFVTGVGGVMIISGFVGMISGAAKGAKIDAQLQEKKQHLENEKKRLIYLSPFSNFQNGGTVGVRISMRF